MNNTTEAGRHSKSGPFAPGAKKVFKSGDSGGKIFNPVQKPKSGSLTAASTPPFVPNLAPVSTGANVARTNKKVAGIQKFYGK